MIKRNNKQTNTHSPQKQKCDEIINLDLSPGFSPKKTTASNIRVLRTNLVYAIGLWADICDETILMNQNYFGKYGNIQKIAINKKPNTDKKGLRGPSYSAVITYQDEVSASLAVISLFQFKTRNGVIRCCYGCTKYCDIFFNGKVCTKNDCPYMHQFDEDRQINLVNGQRYQQYDFERHFNMASDIIFDAMNEITRIFKKGKPNQQFFPDPYESMRILIQNQYISQEQYQDRWTQQNPEQQQQNSKAKQQKQNSNSSCESIQEQIMQLDIEQTKFINQVSTLIKIDKAKSNLDFVQNKPTSPRFIQQFRSFFDKRPIRQY